MKLTEEKIREFGSVAILHKKRLFNEFQKAHRELNTQHTIAIKTITEYSFYNGQEYAYLKMLQHIQLKSSLSTEDQTSLRSEKDG